MPLPTGPIVVLAQPDADGRLRSIGRGSEDALLVTPLGWGGHGVSGVSQVSQNGVATNTTTVVYTVPANTTAYIDLLTLGGINTSGTVANLSLLIKNASGILQWQVLSSLPNGGAGTSVMPMNPPFKMNAGWTVTIQTFAANVSAYCSLHGLEV